MNFWGQTYNSPNAKLQKLIAKTLTYQMNLRQSLPQPQGYLNWSTLKWRSIEKRWREKKKLVERSRVCVWWKPHVDEEALVNKEGVWGSGLMKKLESTNKECCFLRMNMSIFSKCLFSNIRRTSVARRNEGKMVISKT